MNDKTEYERIKNTELREEVATLISKWPAVEMEKGQFCSTIKPDQIIDLITKRETEAYERGQDDELKSGKTFYFNHGVEAMKEALKKHFGISNPKIEGVSWTINEMVDDVAQKLKGEI